MWYPEKKQELSSMLKTFIKRKNNKKVLGIIVPHAGYEFSGEIAGSAFACLKGKNYKKAVILGPSHYLYLKDVVSTNREFWTTPLGKIKIMKNNFLHGDIRQEHSISNQIPFLQYLKFTEILPLMVGEINNEKALDIAKKLSKLKNTVFIFSTDLSHFFPYNQAIKKDKETIKIIENLNFENFNQIDACGFYPLLILMHLCKIKKLNPKLILYKNSGDITKDYSSVVGYASFYF